MLRPEEFILRCGNVVINLLRNHNPEIVLKDQIVYLEFQTHADLVKVLQWNSDYTPIPRELNDVIVYQGAYSDFHGSDELMPPIQDAINQPSAIAIVVGWKNLLGPPTWGMAGCCLFDA